MGLIEDFENFPRLKKNRSLEKVKNLRLRDEMRCKMS